MSSSDEQVALAQSVVEQARRLGLIWTLRFATVVDGTDPGHVSAIFDGPSDASVATADSTAKDLVSIIGTLAPGRRVLVATVPPSGQYIVGGPMGQAANYGEKVGWISLQANSGGVGSVATSVLSSISDAIDPWKRLKLKAKTAYRVVASGSHFSTTAGLLDALQFWVGAVGVGQAVLLGNIRTEGGASSKYYSEQVIRCGDADVENDYFLSSNSTTTGTITQFASVSNSRYLEVRVLGNAADYPGTPTIT